MFLEESFTVAARAKRVFAFLLNANALVGWLNGSSTVRSVTNFRAIRRATRFGGGAKGGALRWAW
jgi:hypothetical protein